MEAANPVVETRKANPAGVGEGGRSVRAGQGGLTQSSPHPFQKRNPSAVGDWGRRFAIALCVLGAIYALFPNPVRQAWCTNITGGTWIPTARYGSYDEPEVVRGGACLNDQELEDFIRFSVENEATFP